MRLPSYPLTRLTVSLSASLTLALTAQAATNVVFLAGARSHGSGEHEFKAGSMLLAKALNEQSGLDVKATVISGWPKDDSILNDAKAIVIYADGTSVVEKGWAKVDQLAKKGTGLMFMHYAVHPSPEQGDKYYRPWIGGAFETDFSVNPHWVADLKALPNHPVSRGVAPLVQAYDEFYYNIRFPQDRSKVLNLVSAVPTRQNIKQYINLWSQGGVDGIGKEQPLMWGIERADGGRGVGFTGGHYHRNWAIDGFRTMTLNAIVWAAGLEVPASGVKSLPLTEDDLNANLDEKGKMVRVKAISNAEMAAIPAAAIQTEREAKFGAKTESPKAEKPKEKGKPASNGRIKPVAESAVITSHTKERLIPLEGTLAEAKELWLSVSSEGDIDTDWADWVEPELVMADGTVKPLTSLKWKSVKTGWGEPAVGKSPDGKQALKVDGKTYANSFGAHADSLVGYDLPAGAVKFRTKVAIDDGGYRRDGKTTAASVRFRVFTQNPGDSAAYVAGGPTEVPVELFTVPEGLEVTLWASSPLLGNPTNIDFDENGRLFVNEGVNYRSKSNRRPEGDRVVILEDTDGDGVADKSGVFTQEKNLISPLGVAVFENQVIVSQPPDLLRYTDVNRDGKYDPAVDKREVIITGFNGRNHDHSLHSLTAGPNGQWYFNQGNTGALFTDKSGKTFRLGSPYDHGEWTKQVADATKIAGERSDDGNVWIGGSTMRMNPDGTNVKIMGFNYRNSFEQTVTSMGDLFQSDNDDPPACRVSNILEGGNAGFASVDGKRSWGADKRPGQDTPTAEWRQEDPGTMPAGDVYGGGSPTGVVMYENGALDAKWNGLLLACEPGKNVIFGYFPKLEGATFKLERFDFLTSNKEKEFAGSDFLGGKPNSELKTKFRPSDVTVGPDGAIYVADWFDARVGGHGTLDDGLSGAIYRIAPKGFKSKVPKIDYATTEGQITALKSPAVNVRFGGFTRLRAQGDKAVPAVAALLDDANPALVSRALWLLAQMGEAGRAKVTAQLQAGDEFRRLVAYRALRFVAADVVPLATKMVTDTSAAVRREVALSLREVPAAQSLPLLVKIAKQFDGKDRGYLEAFGLGSTGKEREVYAAISKDFGPAESWSESSAWLAWRLHQPQSVADLKARALSPKLNDDQRKLMVTALGFVENHAAAVAMIELSADKSFVHKDVAKWWVNNRKNNLWSGYKVDETLKSMGMDPSKVQLVAVELPPMIKGNLPSVADIVKLKGDAKNGASAIAVCYSCHKIGANGVEFGPDLSSFGRQQPTEVIAGAIANPSADISHGFEGSVIKTKDGLTINGMILSKGDTVLIKCMGGQIQNVPKDRIASIKPLERSLMLDPGNMGLTGQTVADIVAYLKSL